ncbi:DUF427 domain-containing protein [Dyella sp. C11]|uniref:DUF427 domain-containing protein n=1 Tax=Dyella sp. C11 TaxID=2126991 RepID=UPI000D651E94|nr:DUF427 domain-containing protein [Dyella sp. C11]
MAAREQRIPGPDHPISVTPSADHIVVRVAGKIVADTRASLSLQEANYPVVHYIPRKNVDMSLLQRTDHHTYCPYKGDCSYYSIPSAGERGTNAVWTYEHPYDAVAAINGHLAFYPTRVDAFEVIQN